MGGETTSWATFCWNVSSLLYENGKWIADAIEAELAHVGADQARRAYHRARYWDERVKMADWWAGEIKGMATQNEC